MKKYIIFLLLLSLFIFLELFVLAPQAKSQLTPRRTTEAEVLSWGFVKTTAISDSLDVVRDSFVPFSDSPYDVDLGDKSITTSGTIFEIPTADSTATGNKAMWDVVANGYGVFIPLHVDGDGKLAPADADSTISMPCVAMSLESGTGVKTVLLQGFIKNSAWSWVRGDIFVSTTTGELTQIPPSGGGDQGQVVGISVGSTIMYFYPNFNRVEILNE